MGTAFSQSPNAPVDSPLALDAAGRARMDQAIAPFVAMARATYPLARQRFESRLPRGYTFYVSVDLVDERSRREQVFVRVVAIDGVRIVGTLASDPILVAGFAKGDELSVMEDAVKDWTISTPDGSEEGNFVGRFLDHYRPGKLFVAVFGFSVSRQGRATNTRLALVTDENTEPLDLDLPPSFLSAAIEKIATESWPVPPQEDTELASENFLPLIFDPEDPETVYGLK